MTKLIYIFPILLLLACNDSKPRISVVEEENLSQKQIDSILDEYNFEYANLTLIDSSDQVIFPVKTQRDRGGSRSRINKSEYKAVDYPNYWNLIFYNHSTGETNLLTESKVMISDFTCNIRNPGPILKNSIIYEISDLDFNKDKRLNYKDPNYLFISKNDGKELKRLSPLNENLEFHIIIPNTDKIIFRTTRDIDNDLDFDKEDEQIWYKIDLSKNMKPIEIIKNTERKLIEKLYFEQWLVKE